MKVVVRELEETQNLAITLANLLLEQQQKPLILFEGNLGAGKTTFIRFFVHAFPQGKQAEVSSPSFNLLNIYPTQPEIAHFDLYRLQGEELDTDLEEVLLSSKFIRLVEWSEHLPAYLKFADWLKISFHLQEKERILEFTAKGSMTNILSSFKKLISGKEVK